MRAVRNTGLRPYQLEAIQAVASAVTQGEYRGLWVMPTGTGKTRTFTVLAYLFRMPTLIVVHRDELIHQTAATIRSISPMTRVGVVKAERNEWQNRDVVIASVQSLNVQRLAAVPSNLFGLLIADECFPAGTMVDGRPIETLKIGDRVQAWDENTNTVVTSRITRVFVKSTRQLVRLTIGNRQLVCTSNHPIYTEHGWKPAGIIQTGDHVLSLESINAEHPSSMSSVWQTEGRMRSDVPKLSNSTNPKQTGCDTVSLFGLQIGVHSKQKSTRHNEEWRTTVLLQGVQQPLSCSNIISDDGKDESEVRLRANDSQQPHAVFGNETENVFVPACVRTQAVYPRRQRTSLAGSPTNAGRCSWLGAGSNCADSNGERQRLSESLQTRHCQLAVQGLDRSRWRFAQYFFSSGKRSEESTILNWERVDAVEVLESGSDGEFERLCPGGVVYNLEVENQHTYFANGVLVHNCHHIAAPSWSRAIRHFEPGFLLGVTATPDRLDGKGLSEWFGKEPLYHYSLIQAIKEKYLVPVCQQAVNGEVCLDELRTRSGDFVNRDLSTAVNQPERNQAIVGAFKEHAADRRAVAFGVDLAHCYDLALTFNEAGIMAAVIDGNMEGDERRELLARFAAGRLQVLVNCEVLTEGFDDPDIDCIIMARPTKSRSLYTQCVGRGLRLPRRNKSKKDCLVLDVTDNCRSHKLMTACSLLGSKQQNAAGKDVLELVGCEEREERERNERIVEDIRGPVRWRLESVCPWPGLPTLDGYKPTASWHDQPASDKQEKMVRGFGLEVQARLTKGEASWLIDKCLAYEAAYPTPATAAQEWRLRYMGAWEEGMTKKEAGRRIGQLMKQESSNEAAT